MLKSGSPQLCEETGKPGPQDCTRTQTKARSKASNAMERQPKGRSGNLGREWADQREREGTYDPKEICPDTPSPRQAIGEQATVNTAAGEQPSGAQDWSQILLVSGLPLGTVLCLSFFIHKMELKGGKM